MTGQRDDQVIQLRARVIASLARLAVAEARPGNYSPKTLADLLCIGWSDDPTAALAEAVAAARRRGLAAEVVETGRGGIVVTPPASAEEDADALVVFEHWRDVTDHGRCRPDAKRLGHIRARLRDGFSVRELCDAVTALSLSPWHNGQNDRGARYTDVHHALKDSVTAQRWIDELSEAGTPAQWTIALKATNERKKATDGN